MRFSPENDDLTKNKPNSNPIQTQFDERPKLMQSVYIQRIMKKNAAMGPKNKPNLLKCGYLDANSIVQKKDIVVAGWCPLLLNIFAGAATFIWIIPAARHSLNRSNSRHEQNVGVAIILVMCMAETHEELGGKKYIFYYPNLYAEIKNTLPGRT